MVGFLGTVYFLAFEIVRQGMKCNDCLFFDSVEWMGDKPKVNCHHPFYVPITDIDPETGCPFRTRKPKEEKQDGQSKLF